MGALDAIVVAAYFVFILGFGSFFSKYATTTHDFFFAGRRFSWWLIALSCVSMVVGSYSFVKYSQVAYEYGFSSTQTYLNDWMLLPLWMFGWFPIVYYSRIQSIPEYVSLRFGPRTRAVMTVLLMLYMLGYIGINFFTMGVAINALIPWSVFGWAAVTALVTALYVSFGGQPSVVMTDLAQGILLILAGFILIFLGLDMLGGFSAFWHALPPSHRTAFSPLTSPPDFAAVGIFWQDGIANTAAFYFLNQGFIMRFLSVRSEQDGRRAVFAVALVLMPLVAISVSAGGWIAAALENAGFFSVSDPKEVFIRVTNFLCRPGLFGFVVAALIAALMSTVDALINAAAAIFVNDVWRPYVRPTADDRHYLGVARLASLAASGFGLLLVPVYAGFKSIYTAHAAFTAAITPPLVTVILLGFLWKRFSAAGAVCTMVGGSLAIAFSFFVPEVIKPFAHGVEPGGEYGHAYMFMRALYGLAASLVFGTVGTLLNGARPKVSLAGLVVGQRTALIRRFKGAEPNLRPSKPIVLAVKPVDIAGYVALSTEDAERLNVEPGDHIYLCDTRWWLGGLHSAHAVLKAVEGVPGRIEVGLDILEEGRLDPKRPISVVKML